MPRPLASANITVIVVTWRGRDLVGGCLDALAAQTEPHELLVVDNASVDGSAEVLAAHPGRPRVLRLAVNAGFAGALAAALPAVCTPYLAWLNDDAQPQPQWLALLRAALDAQPAAAAAASLLVLPGGRVQSCGVRLTATGYGADRADAAAGPVFGFCGGAALLRTAALRAAGGVAAGFFCYYEDTDAAWRLRLAGHGVLAVPAAVVRHQHGASSGHGSASFHLWNERNRLLMLARCAPGGVVLRELARFAAITAALAGRQVGGFWTGRDCTDQGRGAGGWARLAPNHQVRLRLRVLAAVGARLPATLAQRMSIGRRSVLSRRAVWRDWAGR